MWPITNQTELYKLLEKASGKKPKKIKHPCEFLDLLDNALPLIKRKISEDVSISAHAIVEGEVVLGKGVRIFEGAKVRGPVYIGDGSIIGNGALVRESIIGDNCVVGYCTEIARSLIGSPSWFHTNYVGDSVFDGNISMGSGAITANLRLDEAEIKTLVKDKELGTGRNNLGVIVGEGSRFGVNAVPMPGIKIGKNSFVGAGVILNQDLPDGSFCVVRQELDISHNKTKVNMASREKFHKKV